MIAIARPLQRKTATPAPAPANAPQTKQRIVVPFEIKKIDDAARTFEGYSATWDLDLGRDIIHKGAFARTLEHFARGTKSIPLLDSHSYYSIFSGLGTLIDAKEDDTGLWSKWDVIDGDDGDRTLTRLRKKVVRKLSIGYIPIRFDYGTTKVGEKDVSIRNLYELKWEESSLVLFPMNPGAEIDATSIKSLDDLILAVKNGTISDEQKSQLRALLETTPAPEPDEAKGLAPESAERIAMDARLRDLTLLSLGTR